MKTTEQIENNKLYVGQILELPTQVNLTPHGTSILKSQALLKTKKYKVLSLYLENDRERIVLEGGRNKQHDKYCSNVLKIIDIINDN